MGPYKHHHHHQFYGGKRHKSTGVADYFAVLGMDIDDDSFLFRESPSPTPPTPPTLAVPPKSSSQISPPTDNSSSSINDNKGEDVDQNNHVDGTGTDNAAAADDGPDIRITTTSSLENNDTTKTPRNSRNLTKKLVLPQDRIPTADKNNDGDSGGNKQIVDSAAATVVEESAAENDTGSGDDDEKKDRNLHVERFDREIVELALFLSFSTTDTIASTTSNNADGGGKAGGRFECGCWEYTNEEDGSCAIPIVIPPGRRTRRRQIMKDATQSGVKLAYRRRRCSRTKCGCCRTEKEEGNEQSKQPQHYYYTPGVADIAIHYVKLRPSTVNFPNFTSPSVDCYPEQSQTQRHDNNGNNYDGYKDATERAFSKLFASRGSGVTAAGGTYEDGSSDAGSSRAGGVTARHLSSLARQGAGLLVNVVKKTAAQRVPPLHPSPLQSATGGGNVTIGANTMNNHNHDHDVDFDGEFIHNSLPASLSYDGTKRREHFFPDDNDMPQCRGIDEDGIPDDMLVQKMLLRTQLPLPAGYDEWIIPDFCETLHLPSAELVQRRRFRRQQQRSIGQRQRRLPPPILVDRTLSIQSEQMNNVTSPSSVGMEAMYLSPTNAPSPSPMNGNIRIHDETTTMMMKDKRDGLQDQQQLVPDTAFLPILVTSKSVPFPPPNVDDDEINYNDDNDDDDDSYIFIPILAIRRQRIRDEERFHEDPSIVDIQVTHLNAEGVPPTMSDEDENDDDFGRASSAASPKLTSTMIRMQNNIASDIMNKSQWTLSSSCSAADTSPDQHRHRLQPIIMVRRNAPDGFLDIPFAAAKVLDRFPQKNYRGMPFPEEEMPLFCYPGGSYLVRDKLRNCRLPRSFGFVVKNERGDSIYVTCLSFREPLSKRRRKQLDSLSIRRRETSLPHRTYWEKSLESSGRTRYHENYLIGFDDYIIFEDKTICLLGRHPYWTEFRRFLTHLHLLSGSSSDIPIERNISHLLLSVPIPKPGGQCVLVPFSTMNEPMALVMPPLKDLPLVDLSYQRLFAALDVPTVVTIVLGFLCLERKLILISSRQSLLLDCCELLKSLLFPFELCAPYVPHLTQPFMSCLDFPGAIFVGIYDDEQPNGLATIVRCNIPDESIIVELDSGEINCDGNRYETLKAAYQIIPSESRTLLIKEVEALCQDAGIVPGQEPLDLGIDSSGQVIETIVPSNVRVFGKKQEHHEPLDDRSIRDSFLRFFCSILGGYERFLVVPDADYLTSGNDWFDSSSFVGTAPANRTPFLRTLVQTQLFQSFIQRRTEASDVHCMLFDDCLAEYHSSTISFGRLSCDAGSRTYWDDDSHQPSYFLLIDQCATEPDLLLDDDESSLTKSDMYNKTAFNDNDTATQASSGYADSTISDTASVDKDAQIAINTSGDIVTIPSTAHLPPNARFVYCVDGNPSFPTSFDREIFFPKEPDFLETESSQVPAPILTRSEREREGALRLHNMSVSRRGPQKQHRCLWQLAKFMGSQFLGAWLMCIPTQISQPNLSVKEKSKILLRSLGALRSLRSYRRIVADEAAYRALIVACGRCGTDRRVELMKLYGLLRADGIFPNAVTLGQYTKAIAEGYSNAGVDEGTKVGMQVVISSGTKRSEQESFALEVLDNNLSILEESGLKWRSGGNSVPAQSVRPAPHANDSSSQAEQSQPMSISPTKTIDTTTTQRSLKSRRSWLPVCCSSSFLANSKLKNSPSRLDSIRLFAMWSRNSSCKACAYIPLDEEIQSGWDEIQTKHEVVYTVSCPRCGGAISPSICYEEMSVDELLIESETTTHNKSSAEDLNISGVTQDTDAQGLPPQLESIISKKLALDSTSEQGKSGCVLYLSPQNLRISLEELVLEFGEEILERDRLRMLNPEAFFNLWWYSARFSLPLPLPVTSLSSDDDKDNSFSDLGLYDCCSFASWDRTLALEACRSAAKALMAAQSLTSAPDRLLREKLFDNPNTDNPLLSFFNLQNYAQGDWDHPDFSEILVALVQACETRDLLQVVECVCQRNLARGSASINNSYVSMNASFESAGTKTTEDSVRPTSTSLDCYRTILYLARYQCTTAFHAFFPTTMRPCKGYHFWCAQGTAPLPIFDRAFREAAECYSKRKKLLVPIPDVSGVALGFRSVFGHII